MLGQVGSRSREEAREGTRERDQLAPEAVGITAAKHHHVYIK